MAAGLGFKTFNTGEVLTSADVNGYLMQGVLVFASEAARNAAITSPQEGQFAYTKDNNSLWYYTGSAWAASGATGDIEGVTAGTGISGGGTSGTVTITNSMATEIDAKGDLIVGTGADTFARLAVGTDGYTLVADNLETTGLKWAAPAGGGGKVLQVVFGSTAQEVTSASSTFADTGLTATITPTLASSKILVLVSQNGTYANNSSVGNALGLRLLRGATDICVFADGLSYAVTSGGAAVGSFTAASVCYLDEPATTSATTYKTQFKSMIAAATVHVQANFTGIGSLICNSTITLLEIGA